MNSVSRKFVGSLGLGVLLILGSYAPARSQVRTDARSAHTQETAEFEWKTPARWHHGLFQKASGVLSINDSGVTFEPNRGSPLKWSFEQIQTFDLSRHSLRLIGYQNRRWHLQGEREFRFDLEAAVPSTVAAALARRVGKPSENGVPNPNAASETTIPARHRTFAGGTNGILRFGELGIDYITESEKGGRAWRWADIETLALPDPYHLTVGAYRETFSFELKRAMSRQRFDWLWNKVYGRDLAGLNTGAGASR